MRSTLKVALASLIVGLLTACGPKASQTGGRQLEDVEQGSAFNQLLLNGETYDRNFAGSILIWKDGVSDDGVQAVLEDSDEYIGALVAKLQYGRDDILIWEDDFDQAESELVAAAQAQGQRFFQVSIDAASTWLFGNDKGDPGFLAALADEAGVSLSAADLAQQERFVEHYCEAKLWYRAVSNEFINRAYAQRPLANALCTRVYRRKGLFSADAEVCAPAAAGSTKNYFACLWHEGVRKTHLFSLYSDATRRAFAALDTETIRKGFAAGLHQDFLKQKSDLTFKRDDEREVTIPIERAYDPARPGNGRRPSDYGNATVREIQLITTGSRDPGFDGLRLVPHAEREAAEVKSLKAAAKKLRSILKLYDLKANEALFNEPFASEPSSETLLSDKKKAALRAVLPTIIAPQDATLAAMTSQMLKKGQELRSLAVKIKQAFAPFEGSACGETASSVGCRYQEIYTRQVVSALKPDVSVALSQASLRLERPAESRGTLLFTTALRRGAAKKVGCMKLAEGGAHCALEEGREIQVSYDEDIGVYQLRLPINRAVNLGWEVIGRDKFAETAFYSDLAPWQLDWTDVVISLTPNVMGDVVTVFRGDVRIMPRGQEPTAEHTIYAGSVNFVEENSDVATRLGALAKRLRRLR